MNQRRSNILFFVFGLFWAAASCDRESQGTNRFASAGSAEDHSSSNLSPHLSDESLANFRPLALTVNTSAPSGGESLALVSESLEAVTIGIQGGSFCWDRPDGEHVLKAGDALLFNLKAKNCALRVKRIRVASLGGFRSLEDQAGLDTAVTGQGMAFVSEKNQSNVAHVKVLQSPFDNARAQLSLMLSVVTSESVTLKKQQCANKPLHVAVVLDASGSMAGNKWEAARKGALALADRLRFTGTNHDELDVVIFNTSLGLEDAKLVSSLPDRSGNPGTSSLEIALNGTEVKGFTDISKGLSMGFDALKDKQGVKALIILTDGQHNARTTFEPAEISEKARGSGVTLIPIGYGKSASCSEKGAKFCDNVRGLASDPNKDNYIDAWQNKNNSDYIAEAFATATKKLPCPR